MQLTRKCTCWTKDILITSLDASDEPDEVEGMQKVKATLRRKHADGVISMLDMIFNSVEKITFRFESSVLTTMQGDPFLPRSFWP